MKDRDQRIAQFRKRNPELLARELEERAEVLRTLEGLNPDTFRIAHSAKSCKIETRRTGKGFHSGFYEVEFFTEKFYPQEILVCTTCNLSSLPYISDTLV